MATKQKPFLVPVEDLKITFNVRKSPPEDRVLHFAELYETQGIHALPPLKVTRDHRIIDGRTRYQGGLLAKGVKHLPCVFVPDGMTDAELLIYAFKENDPTGSLPPTRSDYEMVIKRLFQMGMTRAEIVSQLPLPEKMASRYVNYAKSHLAEDNLRKAIAAIANQKMTVPQAAKEYKVSPETIEERLLESSKTDKSKPTPISNICSNITTAYQQANQASGQYLRLVMEGIEKGEYTAKDAATLISIIKRMQHNNDKRMEDWANRLENVFKAIGRPVPSDLMEHWQAERVNVGV